MFTLIELPYKSLAPVISDETLGFHHGKHLQAYVDKLNKLIAGTPFESMTLEEIVKSSDGAVFNNAGQILNHELYFTQFCPPSCHSERPSSCHSERPSSCHSERAKRVEESPLLQQIQKQWGTLEAFQADFEAKGVSLFGSGWVWLQADGAGELSIAQYGGADNPVKHGLKPLLTFDVWEHAYYLDYQNRRAAHLKDLWKVVDWRAVAGRY